MYGGIRQFEGVVFVVIGNNKYAVGRTAGFNALDQCALIGVDYIHLIPLEKDVGHGNPFAGDNVSGVVLGYMLDPFTGIRKSAPLNIGTT